MGTAVKGLFKNRWHPQLQFVRCKTKVSVTRPRPPFFERALIETVCKPFFKEHRRPQYLPKFETCVAQYKEPKPDVEHPLKTILVNECKEWFEKSKMIAFFHVNCYDFEENYQCKLLLKKNDMKLFFFCKEVIQKSLIGTKYEEAILPLYKAPTATVFSLEPDMKKLLNIFKKLPKLVFIGCIVENKLLSVSEFQKYGKIENITQARLMLQSVLNSAPQRIVQQINQHPNNIVALLNQHQNILKEQ